MRSINRHFSGPAAVFVLLVLLIIALVAVVLVALFSAYPAHATSGWDFAYSTDCKVGAAYYPGGTSGTLTLTTPHTTIGTYVVNPPPYGVNVIPFATGGYFNIGWQWTPSGGSPQPLVWSYCTLPPPPPPPGAQIKPANPAKVK